VQYYRNKVDKADTVLYKVLYEKIERSITLERLLEVSHGLDTQVNESFNQSASWFAPKNKVYCSSMSLTNRLSMALGINSLGVSEYFQCLYVALGIVMTDDVRHYITVKDRTHLKRLEKVKTKEQKKLRLKCKFTGCPYQ
jgi:activator of 2-hydroxyglutaryl-CoA dehydratase